MSTLAEFIRENPIDNITETLVLSQRLKDYPFKIKPISSTDFSEYQKASTRIQKGGKTEFNTKIFNQMIVLNHTIEPNFRSVDYMNALGCQTPEQAMSKTLLSGEMATLVEAITSLSGFDKDMDELVDEAKN